MVFTEHRALGQDRRAASFQHQQLIDTFHIPGDCNSPPGGLVGVSAPDILDATWPLRITGYDLNSSLAGSFTFSREKAKTPQLGVQFKSQSSDDLLSLIHI